MASSKASFQVAVALAAAAVLLGIANFALTLSNQSTRDAIAERQDYLAQTPQLARVNQLVIGALAETAQRDGNEPLRALLARNGVTIGPPPARPSGTP